MREEFEGRFFCHAVNMVGNCYSNADLKSALLRFINIDKNAQISVSRDTDRNCSGQYGFRGSIV